MPIEFGTPKVAGDLGGNCLHKKNGSQRWVRMGCITVLEGELRSWEILEIIREEEHIPELPSHIFKERQVQKCHNHSHTHFLTVYPCFWTSVSFYQYRIVSSTSFALVPERSCLVTSIINTGNYLSV